MGSLSAGYSCLHCSSYAPTIGANSRFLYLTSLRGSAKLEPSCREHALYVTFPNGRMDSVLPRSSKQA